MPKVVMVKGPVVLKSIAHYMSYIIQTEIDYEMIGRMLKIVDPTMKVPTYREPVEGVDYVCDWSYSTI